MKVTILILVVFISFSSQGYKLADPGSLGWDMKTHRPWSLGKSSQGGCLDHIDTSLNHFNTKLTHFDTNLEFLLEEMGSCLRHGFVSYRPFTPFMHSSLHLVPLIN